MKKHQKHPYQKYEKTILWESLEKGISDLISNEDLIEKTNHNYIIGYLCEILVKNNLFSITVENKTIDD